MVTASRDARVLALVSYVRLMEKLLTGGILLDQFEREYFELFKADETIWGDEEFRILNDVFMDLDSYNADPALRGPGDLNAQQMLDRIKPALETIRLIIDDLQTRSIEVN